VPFSARRDLQLLLDVAVVRALDEIEVFEPMRHADSPAPS